jgi:hypothetical protein
VEYTIFTRTHAHGDRCQNAEYRSSWHWDFNSTYFPSDNASPYLIPPTTPEESFGNFVHLSAPGAHENDHALQPVADNVSRIDTDLGVNREWTDNPEPMINPANSMFGKPLLSASCGAGSDFSPCGGSDSNQCCSAYGVSKPPNNGPWQN